MRFLYGYIIFMILTSVSVMVTLWLTSSPMAAFAVGLIIGAYLWKENCKTIVRAMRKEHSPS
jgi:hypothetical protein